MEETQLNSLCVLCYQPARNGNRTRYQNFFQLFSKYLNVHFKLGEESDKSIGELVTCANCFELGKSFCDLYFQWDYLRVQMEWRVREVFHTIKCAGKDSTKYDAFRKQFIREEEDDGDREKRAAYIELQKLRGELLRGCKKKLSSTFPRVALERTSENKKNGNQIKIKLEKTNDNQTIPDCVVSGNNTSSSKLMTDFMNFVAVCHLSLPFQSQNASWSYQPHHHHQIKQEINVKLENQVQPSSSSFEHAQQNNEKNDNVGGNSGPIPDAVQVPPDAIRAPPDVDVYEEHEIDKEMTQTNNFTFDLELVSKQDAKRAAGAVSVEQNTWSPAIPIISLPGSSQSSSNEIISNCHLCESTFSLPALLTLHLKSVHQVKAPFECSLCGQKHTSKTTFRLHMRRVHNALTGFPGRFKCAICEERFSSTYILKNHVKTHKTDQVQKQRQNQRIKTLRKNQKRGRKQKSPESSFILKKNLNCPICKVPSESQEVLGTHVLKVHKQILAYQCLHCDTQLKSVEGFRSHMYFIHGKAFKSNRELLGSKNLQYGVTGRQDGEHNMVWPTIGAGIESQTNSSTSSTDESVASDLEPEADNHQNPTVQESMVGPSSSKNQVIRDGNHAGNHEMDSGALPKPKRRRLKEQNQQIRHCRKSASVIIRDSETENNIKKIDMQVQQKREDVKDDDDDEMNGMEAESDDMQVETSVLNERGQSLSGGESQVPAAPPPNLLSEWESCIMARYKK